MPASLQSSLGIVVLLALAWAASEDRRNVPWRTVIGGIGLGIVLAGALLGLPAFKGFFLVLNDVMLAIESATEEGTAFVFGYLGGAPPPFEATGPGDTFILAFRALPIILVMSALSALLFHWRILPVLVRGASHLLRRGVNVGGALGIGAAANVFVGMVESPLLVRPYLKEMSRGELFALMTCGMATIAGTMMVLYASVIGDVVPEAMGHILTASLISAPVALAVAALMIPPQGNATTGELIEPQRYEGAMDAVTQGTLQGVHLLINVIAMLIVLVALVAIVNMLLGLVPALDGEAVTLQRLLGYVMAPLVWLAGVPWQEAGTAGSLMGTKLVLNEFIAYVDMSKLSPDALSARSELIMTYALCGFANPGSLGIMIGGLGTLVPERRAEIVALGLRSVVAGALTTLVTGATVGVLVAI